MRFVRQFMQYFFTFFDLKSKISKSRLLADVDTPQTFLELSLSRILLFYSADTLNCSSAVTVIKNLTLGLTLPQRVLESKYKPYPVVTVSTDVPRGG